MAGYSSTCIWRCSVRGWGTCDHDGEGSNLTPPIRLAARPLPQRLPRVRQPPRRHVGQERRPLRHKVHHEVPCVVASRRRVCCISLGRPVLEVLEKRLAFETRQAHRLRGGAVPELQSLSIRPPHRVRVQVAKVFPKPRHPHDAPARVLWKRWGVRGAKGVKESTSVLQTRRAHRSGCGCQSMRECCERVNNVESNEAHCTVCTLAIIIKCVRKHHLRRCSSASIRAGSRCTFFYCRGTQRTSCRPCRLLCPQAPSSPWQTRCRRPPTPRPPACAASSTSPRLDHRRPIVEGVDGGRGACYYYFMFDNIQA